MVNLHVMNKILLLHIFQTFETTLQYTIYWACPITEPVKRKDLLSAVTIIGSLTYAKQHEQDSKHFSGTVRCLQNTTQNKKCETVITST